MKTDKIGLQMGCARGYQLEKCTFYLFFLLIFTLSLTACIDLVTTKSLSKDKNYIFNSKAQVFVMRGGLGGVFSTGMNRLQSALESQYRIRTESTVWYKVDQLCTYIIRNYGTKELPGPIILVGHSLGANEQIKVAKKLATAGIPVELLITIDPVSPLEIPPNVKHAVNVYKPSFIPMFSGLRVKAMDPEHTKIENINAENFKIAMNHFTMDKKEEVQNLMINRSLAAINNVEKKHS